MAQVLKDEQKNKIIDAAKAEFAKKGIKAASLRVIASNAGMTVGNIYRYFSGKDELVDIIIKPVLANFDDIMAVLASDRENAGKQDEVAFFDEELVKKRLTTLADCIAQISDEYRQETLIIINDSEVSSAYYALLLKLISGILGEVKSQDIKTQVQLDVMASMITKSIIAGLNEGVYMHFSGIISKDDFRTVLRVYLTQCVALIAF